MDQAKDQSKSLGIKLGSLILCESGGDPMPFRLLGAEDLPVGAAIALASPYTALERNVDFEFPRLLDSPIEGKIFAGVEHGGCNL
jgi:hypothetical protein